MWLLLTGSVSFHSYSPSPSPSTLYEINTKGNYPDGIFMQFLKLKLLTLLSALVKVFVSAYQLRPFLPTGRVNNAHCYEYFTYEVYNTLHYLDLEFDNATDSFQLSWVPVGL